MMVGATSLTMQDYGAGKSCVEHKEVVAFRIINIGRTQVALCAACCQQLSYDLVADRLPQDMKEWLQ